MKNTDLHTHSHYSDGEFSPREIVRLAKKKGIKNLALTDHDSVKGVNEAIKEGNKIGVNIISGVEMRVSGGEILGYFIDINNKTLKQKIKLSAKKEEGKIKKWCKILKKKGYDISFSEIEKKYPRAKGNINSFYPTQLLFLKGYGKKRQDVFNQIKDTKPKKVKRTSPIEAIKLITQAKGIPVLAHPWVNKKFLDEKEIKSYVDAGMKGIEIDNADREDRRSKKVIEKIKHFAKKYNLIMTKGSDFHGRVMFNGRGKHELGEVLCDEKIVDELRFIHEGSANNIRRMLPSDFRRSQNIIYACVKNLSFKKSSRDFLKHKYSLDKIKRIQKNCNAVVCQKSGKVLATGKLCKNEIGMMYVEPSHQRKKIGTHVMNYLESLAGKKGYRKVYVDSLVSAIMFYKKRDYTDNLGKQGELGSDSVIMEKKLK